MMTNDVEVGIIVTARTEVSEGFFGLKIPPGTQGIVTSIKRYDDVYVEFELGRTLVSQPILCHPTYLDPVQ